MNEIKELLKIKNLGSGGLTPFDDMGFFLHLKKKTPVFWYEQQDEKYKYVVFSFEKEVAK